MVGDKIILMKNIDSYGEFNVKFFGKVNESDNFIS